MMTLRSTSGSVSKSGYAQHVEKRMCTCISKSLFSFYILCGFLPLCQSRTSFEIVCFS